MSPHRIDLQIFFNSSSTFFQPTNIAPHEVETTTMTLKIPETSPTFRSCSIIEVAYYVEVSLKKAVREILLKLLFRCVPYAKEL